MSEKPVVNIPSEVIFIIDGIRRQYTIVDLGWDFRGNLYYVLKNHKDNTTIISKSEFDLIEKEMTE